MMGRTISERAARAFLAAVMVATLVPTAIAHAETSTDGMAHIIGKVTGPNSITPLADVRVNAYRYDQALSEWVFVTSVMTFETGTYDLEFSGGGVCRVYFAAPAGYLSECYRNVPTSDYYDYRCTNLVMASNQVVRNINAALDLAPIDNDPPLTVATGSPEGWDTGWIASAARVRLYADDGDGSGVAQTQYAVNGAPLAEYSGTAITFLAEGITTLSYRSVDVSGNVEELRTSTIRIDQGTPTVSATVVGANSPSASVAIVAADAVSGVASLEWRLDGAATQTVQAASASVGPVTASGLHAVHYRAYDRAGNEATGSVSFNVLWPSGGGGFGGGTPSPVDPGPSEPATVTVPVQPTPFESIVTLHLSDGTLVPVTVRLAAVTAPGVVSVVRYGVSPHAPAGFLPFGAYWDVSFTGVSTGSATITLPYDARLADYRARKLEARTWEGGAWRTAATAVEIRHEPSAAHAVTVSMPVLAPFMLAEPETTDVSSKMAAPVRLTPAYGKSAFVQAGLADAMGVPMPDRGVTVEASRDRVTWSRVATMAESPTGSGKYGAAVRLQSTSGATYARVVFAGDGLNAGTSAVGTLLPQVLLPLPAVLVSAVRLATVSGSMKPAHAGTVVIEAQRKLSSNSWSAAKRVPVRSTGTGLWRGRIQLSKGVWRIRATHSDSGHAPSASAWRTVTVR